MNRYRWLLGFMLTGLFDPGVMAQETEEPIPKHCMSLLLVYTRMTPRRPTGLLFLSGILAAVGLFWLSLAETTLVAFLSAIIFTMGICYLRPALYSVVSERIPRSGALGLGLISAVGMGVVGLVTSPQMGEVADEYAHRVQVVRR